MNQERGLDSIESVPPPKTSSADFVGDELYRDQDGTLSDRSFRPDDEPVEELDLLDRYRRLVLAVVRVIPRLEHWPADGMGKVLEGSRRHHSEMCPPCNLKEAL